MQKKREKLQWRVKHNTSFANVTDFLELLLINNGVKKEELQSFLRPTKKCINDPFKMTNMSEAVVLVHSHLKKDSKILVRVDCDVDGYCSASMLIQFLKRLNPEVEVDYILNYEKKHGLTYRDMSNFTKDQYDLIIIPDASMTVRDARNITNNFSAPILVLDHHLVENEFYDKITKKWIAREEAKEIYKEDKDRLEIDCYTRYCLAVNSTDGAYPNPTLCGAGVVQKFIEAYTAVYSGKEEIEDLTEEYLDLVSLALIADAMDLRNLESRYYTLQGLKERNYHNEFITAMVKHNAEDIKWGRNITSIGWTIAPKINGCIRYGKEEEQKDTFRAILGEQEEREYQPRRKNKNDPQPPKLIQTLQQTMARVCGNVKTRQDTEVRKYFKELSEKIVSQNLTKNTILFVDGTEILQKNTVSGLISNRLASTFFRPVVLMMSKNATEYGGSMRGYLNGPIQNTKEFLESIGVTCMGHENAAGVSFKKDKLEEIIAKCNEKMPLDQLCTIHTVDWEIPAKELRREYIQEVAENYEVFGSTVPAPTFAISGLEINASEIGAFGQNANFIRFTYNGIPFSKKYCAHDDYENMTLPGRNTLGGNKKNLKLNIIGQFILNAYDDKVTPEVQILYFDSEEVEKSTTTGSQNKKEEDDWDFEEAFVSKKPKNNDEFDW